MKDIEFVIAKYKEDTNWTDMLHPYRFIIYDKSENGDLPNIGRETHTYLHHIIENYDKLADVTVFLQGHPFDHIRHRDNSIKNKDEIEHFIKTYPFDKTEPFFTEHTYTLNDANDAFYLVFGEHINHITFTAGALWIVQKADILARPRIFYETMQERIINARPIIINPWTLERMWQFIFNPNIPIATSFYEKNS